MGVCIETVLKPTFVEKSYVTPYMGVCIETPKSVLNEVKRKVTPYMGVCIETTILLMIGLWVTQSHVGTWIGTRKNPTYRKTIFNAKHIYAN